VEMMKREIEKGGEKVSCLVVGDFNSIPNSLVYRVMTGGKVNEDTLYK
jgi:endonuclease/exonuclease/phosphatase family metal-dependent hydrolase